MKVCEVSNLKVEALCRRDRIRQYAVIYKMRMLPSEVKSIVSGKSKDPKPED